MSRAKARRELNRAKQAETAKTEEVASNPTPAPVQSFDQLAKQMGKVQIKPNKNSFVTDPFASTNRSGPRTTWTPGPVPTQQDGPTERDLAHMYGADVTSKGSIYRSEVTWEALFSDRKNILSGISSLNWLRPSKIQGEALPQILQPGPDGKFRNLKAQAHHGSGKTGTFVLAMLHRCDAKLRAPQAVCVCPTRELALQECEVVTQLGRFCGITVCRAVKPKSGEREKKVPITDQIVVGTPGAIKYRLSNRMLDPRGVKMLVIDEADNVLKNGSLAVATKFIKKKLPRNVQVLLFSATFPKRNEKEIQKFLGPSNQKIEILVQQDELKIQNVHHFYINCAKRSKLDLIKDIYDVASNAGQSIIFVNTKKNTKRLFDTLNEEGYTVSMLSSGLTEAERDERMEAFRNRQANVLIATNVLAFGIDVPAVKMVVNFDIPYHYGERSREPDAQAYIHRIGRAGRFARKGVGINLLETRQQLMDLQSVVTKFKIELNKLPSGEDQFELLSAKIQEKLSDAPEKTAEKEA